jgi:DNA-binding transcriptional ArsR family regulator
VGRASILLRLICEPTRLEVIVMLAEGEQSVGTLCDRLSQSQPTVSHHLALLRHGGIVASRRQGAKNIYQLSDTGWEFAGLVQNLIGYAPTRALPVQARPSYASSPAVDLAHRASENSINASGTADQHSSVSDVDEEVWRRLNRRRAELIFKKNRGQLSEAEQSELEFLQAASLSRMQQNFAGPTLIDNRLEEIEQKHRGGGV